MLDNAEPILDPQGIDAEEICAMVEELSQLENICLCITSRISTIPTDCETFEIPKLPIEAARDAFYQIYKNGERSDLMDNILDQLDFHPLSITLLATVAHHNKWDVDRLTREWDTQRTRMLQIESNRSLAATIELLLTSSPLQELGPDARALLSVIAFFPQGVNDNNFNWLFPTIPNGTNILDKLCALSLTYRSDGFTTMLAPLRDYLSPKDPKSSMLLCTAKERYCTRMSVKIDPDKPDFGGMQWITLEDINVEHLLDVFTTIDEDSDGVWDACAHFMHHLVWHKRRLTVLGPKVEGLPDNHRSKPGCLLELSRLFNSVGNRVERKRLLTHALELWREQGNELQVAQTLYQLSDANQHMGLPGEGIQMMKEALEIYGRLGDTTGQARCLLNLTSLLRSEEQVGVAREVTSAAIDFFSEEHEQFQLCESHRALGQMYQSKGETEKAIHQFEAALRIASLHNWQGPLFLVHLDLAMLFHDGGMFDDANIHIEHAKSHAINDTYSLARASQLQAKFWCGQYRLEQARSEALRTADIFEKLGAVQDLETCRGLLQWIEEEINGPVALYFDGKLFETVILPTFIDSPFSRGMEGIGWHRLASLSRHILLLTRLPRRTAIKSRLGKLRTDVHLLVACLSLVAPFILPSQYALSLPAILLYLCIVMFLVYPRR